MPLQATSGAASYDAFGGGVPVVTNYIEDVFSTYLFTGASAAQTITNGIDLSGKGGLVWMKSRSAATNHYLADTARGANQILFSDDTSGQLNFTNVITAFSSTGFTAGDTIGTQNFASWTFRKQPKFFDIQTWTGTGSTQTINHNLGCYPSVVMVKKISSTGNWVVGSEFLSSPSFTLYLNTTGGQVANTTAFAGTNPTGTQFTVGTSADTNASGATYVAYLFASNKGGFGLTGTDNVISCGSYTGNGSTTGPVVTLGYEPQWIMVKNASATTDWVILDTMRGLVVGGTDRELNPNQSGAESGAVYITPTATGFQLNTTNGAYNASGNTFIYVAIRRGPMKVPTTGTSVYNSVAGAAGGITTGIVTDTGFIGQRSGSDKYYWSSRLTGHFFLNTTSTDAQDGSQLGALTWDRMNGFWNNDLTTYQGWGLKRAPSFHDVVCYTGTSTDPQNYNHNLQSIPEMMIVRRRNQAGNDWFVYHKNLTSGNILKLNTTASSASNTSIFTTTAPTASVFTVGGASDVNSSSGTYVWYGFATCAGVSKVGSYTGNGTTQTIDCGFGAGGARFVLIKRTDSTGGWYVYDTARGMTVLTDPYLFLNTTGAEVATLGSVTTVSTGFALNSTILAAINVSSGTYIFLAIA